MKKSDLQNKLNKIGISYAVKDTKKVLEEKIDKTKQSIQSCIDHHEKHRNSFFWSPPSNASARRNEESRKTFETKIGKLSFESAVSCSCKCYYYKGKFYDNGEKKTMAAFKKALKTLS